MHEVVGRLLHSAPADALQHFPGLLEVDLGTSAFAIEVGASGAKLVPAGPPARAKAHLSEECLRGLLDGSRDLAVAFRRGDLTLASHELDSLQFAMAVFSKLVRLSRFDGELRDSALASLFDRMKLQEHRTVISPSSARSLYDLTRDVRPHASLEVGFAYGTSAIAIGLAMAKNGHGSHVAIDPFQESHFQDAGLRNVEAAGLGSIVSLIRDPDYFALPRLLQEGHRVQLAFIDGSHLVDYTHVDFFYVDRLLAVGGTLVLDDVHLEDVDDVVRYVVERRSGSYEPLGALSSDRWTVFRKTQDDPRTESSEGKRVSSQRRV